MNTEISRAELAVAAPRGALRKHRITDDELRTTLHQHGILHVGEVKRAFVEPDGEITIIKQTEHEEAQSHLRRRRSCPPRDAMQS